MRTIVIDLDGTLCDSAHRDHHARNGDWLQFHERLKEDKPHADVMFLIELLRNLSDLRAPDEVELVGCTGRNERWRPATERWLIDHGIPLDAILMRADDDFRSDAAVKVDLLNEWHKSTGHAGCAIHERVAFILDDRDKVVEAWRDAGFNCWQVRPGNF